MSDTSRWRTTSARVRVSQRTSSPSSRLSQPTFSPLCVPVKLSPPYWYVVVPVAARVASCVERFFRRTISVVKSTDPVPAPLVVNFHGGGYVQGDLAQSDWFCGQVSLLAGAVVVSVDYRLAPEHPFPIPAQDAYAATAALAAEPGRWGIDPARVAVMGDSAGGNLATVVCLMARDARHRGERAPVIGAQCLVYPGTEMVEVLPSERAIPYAPILNASDIRGFVSLYLAGADGTVPYASPLRADLTDLPPALVQTAEHDPLRDHGTQYVDALRGAGVPVRHTEYQGTPHGYISMPRLLPSVAHQAAWEVAHWVRSELVNAPTTSGAVPTVSP